MIEFNDNPETSEMKRFIAPALLAACFGAPAALAQDIVVNVPKDLSNPKAVAAYRAELNAAVNRVCTKASEPVIGINWYIYLNCVKATRADVARKDPTGLLAAGREATRSLDLAEK